MRKQLLSIFFFFSLFAVSAQAQQWQWGKRAQNRTKEIAVDNHGNTYVLWTIGSQANVDGHPVAVNGSTDIGITSFRCDGSYRWTKVIGTSSSDAGFGVGTDTLGGVYILAHIGSGNASNIYIDDDDTLPPTMKKLMLLKYDTTGNFLWQRMPEPEVTVVTPTAGFNLTVEKNGNAHVMCVLEIGDYANGAFSATYSADNNIYALKYDKSGNFLGGLHFDVTRPANAGISPYGFYMMYDPISTHYYWNGIRYDPNTISFGSIPITGLNFLACFSSTGNVLWVQKSNNESIYTALNGKPAIDRHGNVYVTGVSYNDINGGAGDGFGAYNFNNTMGIWGFPILVKFNSSGTVLYANNASGNTDNAGRVVICSHDTVALAGEYAGGNFEWDGIPLGVNNQYYNDFVAKFDAATGNIISIDTLYSGSMVDEYVTALVTDHRGNFYLGGEFSGNITIAGVTHSKQDGNTDGYIAKLGSSDCTCPAPVAAFNHTASGLTVDFTYTGSANVDSVVWTLGNGTSMTGNTIEYTYGMSGTYTVCATAYNSCGTHQICTNVNITGLGINAAAGFLPDLTIYPNPTSGVLSVDGLESETSYRIYSSLGAEVQNGVLASPGAQISMKDLNKGCYLLYLRDQKGNAARIRIMLQ